MEREKSVSIQVALTRMDREMNLYADTRGVPQNGEREIYVPIQGKLMRKDRDESACRYKGRCRQRGGRTWRAP